MTDALLVDPLSGAKVLVVPERQGRPNLPDQGCPFCVGGREAPEPYDVHVFPNRWPSLPDGRAEVVLFSPDHTASLGTLPTRAVARVVERWTERTAALGARSDVDYVLIFENRGEAIGATIRHPHGQIYAFDVVPPVVETEFALAEQRGWCALCAEQAPERVVAERGRWRAWIPEASAHPYGLVIAPRDHLGSLTDLDAQGRHELAGILGHVLGGLDELFQEETPYMLWIHQRPTTDGVWPWAHLHLEVVPHRRAPGVNRYVAAAELGSGIYINTVDPVEATARLTRACTVRGAT